MVNKFKTNINCVGCLATVTPHLDSIKGVDNWEVNLDHPDRVLTVHGEKPDAGKIISVLQDIGFIATTIKPQ